MKHTFWLSLVVLALPLLACTITLPLPAEVTTGPTETFTVNVPAPKGATSDAPVKVALHMGAGELKLQGGADGLAQGKIDYNIPDWKPTLTSSADGLLIEQSLLQNKTPSILVPGKDNQIVNNWDLKLGQVPMSLELKAGAYKADMNLSGLALRNLTISDGASDTQVTFDSANPEVMDVFTYGTGASSVKLTGLGYANFKEMNFTGGVGNYQLDFAGPLQRNATVSIEAGMSTVRLSIPSSTKAAVVISGGMKDVKTEGTWTASEDTYTTAAASAYTLTIKVNIGLGSLTLATDK